MCLALTTFSKQTLSASPAGLSRKKCKISKGRILVLSQMLLISLTIQHNTPRSVSLQKNKKTPKTKNLTMTKLHSKCQVIFFLLFILHTEHFWQLLHNDKKSSVNKMTAEYFHISFWNIFNEEKIEAYPNASLYSNILTANCGRAWR